MDPLHLAAEMGGKNDHVTFQPCPNNAACVFKERDGGSVEELHAASKNGCFMSFSREQR